jgi:glucokinase
MLKIGIDLGGHTISAAAAEADGGVLRFVSRAEKTTPSSRSIGDVVGCLSGVVRELAGGKDVQSVGVGIPGFVDLKRKKIVRLTNFHSLENIEFASLLEEELASSGLRAPVLLENDANCAAVGEGACGAAAGCRDYVVFTLGTGIGSGIVANGKLLSGTHGMAGEAGHMSLTSSKVRCGCGAVGHVEQAASADWLENNARVAGLPGDFKLLWSRRKEPAVAVFIEPALDALSRCIASVSVLVDPEVVILSGGMSRAEGLADELSRRVEAYLPVPFRRYLALKVSKLGSDAALWGALSLPEGECK